MNDSTLIFSDSQEITTIGTTYSTNILQIDATKEVAYGTPADLLIQVTETFNNIVNAEVQVQTATDSTFTTPVVLESSGVIALSDLVAGYKFNPQFLPKGNLGYLRLAYITTGATAPTTGAIFAGIVDGIENSYHNS